MTPSDHCAALVGSFESCKLHAYPDPGSGGDPWTIGYGATGPDIKQGVVWTQAQADARFAADLAKFAAGVSKLIIAPTNQDQFDALVSFAFNCGLENLRMSTLLRKHNDRNYPEAADQFGRWSKSHGKTMAGLVRRRAAEAALYRGE